METRVRTAMSLYAFTVLGMFLLVAPWSPVWDQAAHALFPARLGIWVRTGWVRGLVSGLGALDLAVAFQVGRELWRAMRVAAERNDRDPDPPR